LYIVHTEQFSTDRKESMDHAKEMIDLIKSTPAVRPPDDFTARVMKAVMKEEGLFERSWRALLAPRVFPLDPFRALRAGSGQEELGVYFLLAAFAHLILGAVLMTGFSRIDTATSFPGLFGMQPWLSFLLALWLGVWGGLLKRDSKRGGGVGLKGARFAALIYIEAVVVNGVLLLMAFRSLPLVVPFVAFVVVGTVAVGIFLAVTCRNGKIGTAGGASALT
jgi:hypothetical protein